MSLSPPGLVAVLVLGAALGILAGLVGFLIWRSRFVRAIRADAVVRSRAVVAGKIQEQLAPFLPGFGFDPRDARFLGSPVDLVIFDGLARGGVERVIFLEVKTGGSQLSTREHQVRAAIEAGRIEWREWRL
jgi:predicted Holliday junction resolvase-like endonuclease